MSAPTPAASLPDKKIIVGNYRESTNSVAAGARAYVVATNNGNGNDRVVVAVRSKGGRWIQKWERTTRLENFRLVTVPTEHPRYADCYFDNPDTVDWLNRACGERRRPPGSNE